MKLERLTDLREHSFSSPDFQVGVRNDTDGGKLGGKLGPAEVSLSFKTSLDE